MARSRCVDDILCSNKKRSGGKDVYRMRCVHRSVCCLRGLGCPAASFVLVCVRVCVRSWHFLSSSSHRVRSTCSLQLLVVLLLVWCVYQGIPSVGDLHSAYDRWVVGRERGAARDGDLHSAGCDRADRIQWPQMSARARGRSSPLRARRGLCDVGDGRAWRRRVDRVVVVNTR